jgi:hypothetical protein
MRAREKLDGVREPLENRRHDSNGLTGTIVYLMIWCPMDRISEPRALTCRPLIGVSDSFARSAVGRPAMTSQAAVESGSS